MKKVFAFIVFGIMLLSLAGCSLLSSKPFTPDKDSNPISGAPKVAGEEISLPCKVKDLKNKGFETDYLYEKGYVKMWHVAEERRGNNLCMYLCLDKGNAYKEKDSINDEDTVSAIMVTQFDKIEFDLKGIRIWLAKDEVLKIAGTPAYRIKLPLDGEYCFYLGDNDLIYRFKFMATDKVEEVLFGTKAYMTDDKGRLKTD